MEFLVTMTTHVPDGVAEDEVDAVRAREAQHSRELARQGRLLRLWRPPLRPGEWRSLGVFEAADHGELEEVLLSMPLRVWRTDEATPLAPHPNDPGRGAVPIHAGRTEFLTTFRLTGGTGVDEELAAREARRTAELAADGHLIRLWRLPDEGRNLGDWQAADEGRMHEILAALPMASRLDTEVLRLSRHPSDPVLIPTVH